MVQNLQQLLNFSDSNSIAHGVEARLPFLYHKLVDFVFHYLPIRFTEMQPQSMFIVMP